jgi:hypothetical protein
MRLSDEIFWFLMIKLLIESSFLNMRRKKLMLSFEDVRMRNSWVVWPSGWVRTLFLNPTQPDGQNPKSSPRIRTPELAQNSSSNRIACSAQSVGQTWPFNPRVDHSIRDFCMSRDSGWVLDEQVCLSDSIRRTRTRTRSILSNKNPNSFNPLEQKECVQPCPILGLNARARVQFNPTVTLFMSLLYDKRMLINWWFICYETVWLIYMRATEA